MEIESTQEVKGIEFEKHWVKMPRAKKNKPQPPKVLAGLTMVIDFEINVSICGIKIESIEGKVKSRITTEEFNQLRKLGLKKNT